jgi:hypothetical protein
VSVLDRGDLDLGFAAQRWRSFVVRRRPEVAVDRRALEVCVFIHLADALQTAISTSSAPRISPTTDPSSCRGPNVSAGWPPTARPSASPNDGEDFTAMLKAELTAVAAAVDTGLPTNTELSIADDGTPHLKQMAATTAQPGANGLRARSSARACRSVTSWTFSSMPNTGPVTPGTSARPSGADPKLAQGRPALSVHRVRLRLQSRPGQTARHAPGSQPRRRCAGSTRSTSTPTSWKRRWST